MENCDIVWHIVWCQMAAHEYTYELTPGDPTSVTSFRIQISSLKRAYAVWYREWQTQGIPLCFFVDERVYV